MRSVRWQRLKLRLSVSECLRQMGRMANSWRGSLTAAGLFEFAVLAVLPNCHGFCHDPHPNQICARDLEGICCQAQNEYLQAGRKWLAENQKQSVHTGRRSARTADAEEVIILAPADIKTAVLCRTSWQPEQAAQQPADAQHPARAVAPDPACTKPSAITVISSSTLNFLMASSFARSCRFTEEIATTYSSVF